MELNVNEWKEFQIGKMFEIYPTKDYKGMSNTDLNDGGTTPVIANSAINNGINGFSTLTPTEEGNIITFSDTTEGNTFFYQPDDFIGFAHVQGMHPIEHKWSEKQLLFLATVLTYTNCNLFNYGRKMRRDTISASKVKLPVQKNGNGYIIDDKKKFSDDGYIPDWEFMEDYIKSIHHKKITTNNATNEMPDIKIDEWKEFKFGNLISKIYKAKALNKEDLLISDEKSNSIRYITRTSEDNGCEFRAVLNEINPSFIEEENAISIGDTTATCFYQSEKFITGDHMVVVRADWLNKTNALFIVAVLNKEQYKYSYGRAFLMDRIKDTIIKLPVKKNADGKAIIDDTHKYSEDGYMPDWEFMENYIKSLPYGDRI